MPKRVNYDIELIGKLESEKKSLRDIAKLLGKDHSTLVRWLNSNCNRKVKYSRK